MASALCPNSDSPKQILQLLQTSKLTLYYNGNLAEKFLSVWGMVSLLKPWQSPSHYGVCYCANHNPKTNPSIHNVRWGSYMKYLLQNNSMCSFFVGQLDFYISSQKCAPFCVNQTKRKKTKQKKNKFNFHSTHF